VHGGNAVARDVPSAVDTSSAASAAPSDWVSSSQRRTCSCSAAISRRDREIAQPTIPRTITAATRIESISITKLRRAAARTEERGRSSARVHLGAAEFANATARSPSPLSPVVSPSTPSPLRMRLRSDAFSGFAKLLSVSCWPARSITIRSSKPRSFAR